MANIARAIEEFRDRIQQNLPYLLNCTYVGIELLLELFQRHLLTKKEFEKINVSRSIM